MPKKSELKCYFGCVTTGPLHKFPKWEYPNSTRFIQWKNVLDPATQEKGNVYIFNSMRLCNRHFEDYFISKHSNLLTRNAVPTLNLVHTPKQAEQASPTAINQQPTSEIVPPNQAGQPTPSTINQTDTPPNIDFVTPKDHDYCQRIPVDDHDYCLKIPVNQGLKRAYSVAFPSHPVAGTAMSDEAKKGHRKPKNNAMPVISSKQRRHFTHDISQKTIKKLKDKLQNIRKKCKTQSRQILAAKKLSQSTKFLTTVDKMPANIGTFVKMQIKYEKKPRGRRFTIEEKIMALTIYKQGPKVYSLLKSMFVLPSKRSLQKLLGTVTFKPGLNQHIMNNLKNVVKKMPEEKKLINLLFDEMALQPGLMYNSTADTITGFENFGDDKNQKIADHALVFMIKGIKGKTKQPICFTFCQSATKKDTLKRLITTIIRELRTAGLKVIATVCDQAATNMAVIKSLHDDTRAQYLRESQEYNSKAFEIDKIKVYPLFDPPHLLKGVRNNLLKKDAIFTQNGKQKKAKWEHIEKLFDMDEGDDEVRILNKLTEMHVKADKIPKMKVRYAAQVFSQRVSAVMRFLARKNILPVEAQETADFLLIFDKLFDSFNGHSYKDDSKNFKSCLEIEIEKKKK